MRGIAGSPSPEWTLNLQLNRQERIELAAKSSAIDKAVVTKLTTFAYPNGMASDLLSKRCWMQEFVQLHKPSICYSPSESR